MSRRLFLAFWLLLPALAHSATSEAWSRIQKTRILRWCGDTSGGAPYVFVDKNNPGRVIGFEVDLMNQLADRMGVHAQLVVVPWEDLVPALLRDDCDVIVNGLEITEERQRVIDFSRPYYVFSEQLTLRKGGPPLQTLDSLKGHRIGTLGASLAENILKKEPTITSIAYPSGVEAYRDLELGRVDAVLMDDLIAAWYAQPNPALDNQPRPLGQGLYGMGVRKDSPLLRSQLDDAIGSALKNGDLKRLYTPWNLWTAAQATMISNEPVKENGRSDSPTHQWTRFIPTLLKGAAMTVLIAVLSMALAVLWGSALCYARLFGSAPVRWMAHGYIELIRGTPLLIQLFLLYYGLPNLGLQLNAFVAAVLGMGLNYAAYEAEIYRSAYLAIPRGQFDAARSLGMTLRQSLRYVMIPQAIRVALAPSTNDFIALFKDTSLVSVITVFELTKAYSTAATTTYRFLELGLVTAFLYFLMSYPLALWSRRLEKHHHVRFH